jgi:hypothetical protein
MEKKVERTMQERHGGVKKIKKQLRGSKAA